MIVKQLHPLFYKFDKQQVKAAEIRRITGGHRPVLPVLTDGLQRLKRPPSPSKPSYKEISWVADKHQ